MSRNTRKSVLTLAMTTLLAAGATQAADHLDSPTVRTDPAADINDVYAFINPNRPKELVLIASVLPLANTSSRFSDVVRYRFHIDNGIPGDETVITCTFPTPGRFTCSGNHDLLAQGALDRTVQGTGMKAYSGLRDDPFFFDLTAFNATRDTLAPAFTDPGINFFQGLNTLNIVLGIQSDRVNANGSAPVLKIHASTARVAGDGSTVQIDRMGRPAINTALIDLLASTGKKDAYNASASPANWASQFQAEMASNLAALDTLDGVVGNALLPPDVLASVLVDDRLVIDTSIPSCDAYLAVELGVPNQCGGRTLDRDVIDDTLGAVVGPGVSDHVGNDSNFTGLFPFLARPNN